MQEQKRYIRWYDRYPNISELMLLTENLPKSLQEQVGVGLHTAVSHYQEVVHKMPRVKNLGAETVLSLYKSKKKQRWYDEIPQLHEAMNIMLTMPDAALLDLDDRCSDLLVYIRSQSKFARLGMQLAGE